MGRERRTQKVDVESGEVHRASTDEVVASWCMSSGCRVWVDTSKQHVLMWPRSTWSAEESGTGAAISAPLQTLGGG